MRNPKSILITGGSSGIGEALALEYAAPGVRLALTGRSSERLDAVADSCRAKGAEVSTSVADVRDAAALRAWIEAEDDKTPLDLVIANAGVSRAGLEDMDYETRLRSVLTTNVESRRPDHPARPRAQRCADSLSISDVLFGLVDGSAASFYLRPAASPVVR